MSKLDESRILNKIMQKIYQLKHKLENNKDTENAMEADDIAVDVKIAMNTAVNYYMRKFDNDEVREIAKKFVATRFPGEKYDCDVEGSYAWEWKLRFESKNPTSNMDAKSLDILFDILDKY